MTTLCDQCGGVNFRRSGSQYCSDRCYYLADYAKHRQLKPSLHPHCLGCGQELPDGPWASKRKYCSRQCRWERRTLKARGITKAQTCKGCGEPFSFIPTQGQVRRYCSTECRIKSQKGKYKIPSRQRSCKVCGELFWPPSQRKRICSSDCRGNARRTIWPHTKIAFRQCHICQRWSTIKASSGKHRLYCRPCGEMVARQKDVRTRHGMRLHSILFEPYTLAEIAARDGYRCGLCGQRVPMNHKVPRPKAPTIDHIIPLAGGGHDIPANVQLAHFLCNSKATHRGIKQLRLAV